MYQRARKLATLNVEPSNFVPTAELQMEAYLGAINALSLVDQKVAWIAIPLTAESDHLVRHHMLTDFIRLTPPPSLGNGGSCPDIYPGGTVRTWKKRHGDSQCRRHPLRLHASFDPIGVEQDWSNLYNWLR